MPTTTTEALLKDPCPTCNTVIDDKTLAEGFKHCDTCTGESGIICHEVPGYCHFSELKRLQEAE